jgi:hypothetical protein
MLGFSNTTFFIQGINFSQTQQLITQNILMATCFDSVESSSGLPKNRSNVSKFIVHSGISNTASGFLRTDPMYQIL